LLAICTKASTYGSSRPTARDIFCKESFTSLAMATRPWSPRLAARLWIISSRLWMYRSAMRTSGRAFLTLSSTRAYHDPCLSELSTRMLRLSCSAATRLNSVTSPASSFVIRAALEGARSQ